MTTPTKAAKAAEKPAETPDGSTATNPTPDTDSGAVDDMAMVDESASQLAGLAQTVEDLREAMRQVDEDRADAERRLALVEGTDVPALVSIVTAQSKLLRHLASLLPTGDTEALLDECERSVAALAGRHEHDHVTLLRERFDAHDAQMAAEAAERAKRAAQ